ncbi:MAG: O-antigen ligase domain-containing protein, partial [Candidatus Parcubacteria bacterium]|nr:O-antigen ligase domain-containing protein [Burkholderiales bacterium]
MPEHLRALLVILALAGVVFAFARKISGGLFPAGVFEHRRNLWLGITLAAFLAHNFWVFIFAAGVLLLIAAAKDEDKVGLVLFVLLA